MPLCSNEQNVSWFTNKKLNKVLNQKQFQNNHESLTNVASLQTHVHFLPLSISLRYFLNKSHPD